MNTVDGWFLGVSEEYLNNAIENRLSRKYHCFDGGKSFCGRYSMDTDYYETEIESGEILKCPHFACKKCYAKWLKIYHIVD